jgi:predicted methyltransferase
MLPIITKKEAEIIFLANSGSVRVSLDLGKSMQEIKIDSDYVVIGTDRIHLEEFKNLKPHTCYVIHENALKKLVHFAEETNFYYKLVPTGDWPTITLSSTPMHRYIHISPRKAARLMVNQVAPIKGNVLDTCCGLGYTTIISSKHADKVYTFEKDKYVLNFASYNPYSEELFNSKKIELLEADVFSGIKKLKSSYFNSIIHDPPTYKYAPELYSGEFYKELFRVLKNGGKLYHYAPCPQKTKDRNFYTSIIKRLNATGFKKVHYIEEASGVAAQKF